mgnify:CR=1 FL=1
MDDQNKLLSEIGGDEATPPVPQGSFDPSGGNHSDDGDPSGTGGFSGDIRGKPKGIAKVNKKVKAAVLGTLAVAVILVFVGVEHTTTPPSSASAPNSFGGSGAKAPTGLENFKPASMPKSAVASTESATSATASTSSSISKTSVPVVDSQAAKELAELQKIRWDNEKQRYTDLENAKTQAYQAGIQDAAMAKHANPGLAFPSPKPESVKASQPSVLDQNPNTANPSVGLPPYPQAGGGGGKYAQENEQAAKAAFLAKAEKADEHDYLHQVEKSPISPFELQAGSVIPAVLITGIDSDLPGQIIGEVNQSVYSDINGKLLIPEGTKLIGMYNSSVSYGQNRVQVVWSRMIFPNGNSMNIGFEGADTRGYSGFHDLTNTHFWSIMGDALLYSVLGAVPELASGSNTNTSGGTSVSQALAQSTGQELAQTGQQFVQKGMNRQPTIHIRPGYKFDVIVSRDMVFPGAYRQ